MMGVILTSYDCYRYRAFCSGLRRVLGGVFVLISVRESAAFGFIFRPMGGGDMIVVFCINEIRVRDG
jgi:hypothetical protein